MADFFYTPSVVTPGDNDYPVHLTQAEDLRKEALLIDVDPMLSWKLTFKSVPVQIVNQIENHYKGQKGTFTPFMWTSFPAALGDGQPKQVRYRSKPVCEPIEQSRYKWNVYLEFEIAYS